ncbi:hypothetical protein NM688_g6447 [Phlebia brevispora]|uniref:Uncharacterized protein n=1 Tax=Phlebia brevispora TaxID=194682 RepID=A0ACC1SG61_9APHY|nr:hypothetical protein NM688_g6447 [Phlebia brevispora]
MTSIPRRISDSPLGSVRRWFGSLGKKRKEGKQEGIDYGGEVGCDEQSTGEDPSAWTGERLEHLDCMCARSDPSASKYVDQDAVNEVTESLTGRYNTWKEWYDARASDMSPQSIVIYSNEELRENVDLDVPLQIKHTTIEPVISSSLTSEPCERLGIDGLLSHFNELLSTSYSVETPGLRRVLEQCIERRYDFGMAFGRLRTLWFDWIGSEDHHGDWERVLRSDFTNLIQLLEDREQKDEEDRRNAFDRERNLITNPFVDPRRLWDLNSNRVVPIYAVHESYLIDEPSSKIWPVSHSWMAEERRCQVDTPINGHEWRVPFPSDTTLDRVRIELLNLGAEYVWLDVLCLRQADSRKPESEQLRKSEWELDVPTIGQIYSGNPHIVTYLNGLGRPFEVGDTTNPRHWINRAWTLQEGSVNTLIGGLTAQSPFLSLMQREESGTPDTSESERQVKQVFDRLCMALHTGFHLWSHVFPALEAMLNRTGTYEIDRIAGLAFMLWDLGSERLPVYLCNEDSSAARERAWRVLLMESDVGCCYHLAYLYPVPGDDDSTWRPSWRQLTAREIPLGPMADIAKFRVCYEENAVREGGALKLPAPLVRNCTIQLLAEPNAEGYCRRGKLTVNVGGFIKHRHSFTVEAHHQQRISEDQKYVLVGNVEESNSPFVSYGFWIVGIETKPGSIRKVTVLRMESEDDRDRLIELDLAPETEVTII